jgi:hypothetical protein
MLMIVRGRVTWLTVIGLAIGIAAAYFDYRRHGEGAAFILLVVGWIALSAFLTFLFERGRKRTKRLG